MISHSKKFIFAHPHRTGGSSIELPLKRYSIHKVNYRSKYGVTHFELKHATIPMYVENNLLTKEQYDEYYKFAIVRNPWERALSWYFWRIKIHKDPHANKLLETTNNQDIFSKSTFIDICNDEKYRIPPLVEDLVDINGEFNIDIYDRIIRLETIDDDFNKLCDDLGIRNKKVSPYCKPPYGGTKHKHYTEYYDNDLIKLVSDIYKDDIEQFKYKYGK